MRYLLTGGAGFIGSHLADALVQRGHQVLILDDLSTGSPQNVSALIDGGGAELVEGSVLDQELVDGCMRACDACVHLAAAVGVKLVVDRPLDSLRRNVRGADTVIYSAGMLGRRLLFASSSEVYGRDTGRPLSETSDRTFGSPLQARWAYATSKTFGEAMVHACVRELDADMVVARLFNVVGPRQTGNYGMVLPRFVRQALREQDLTVFGDGSQTRCFLHVRDAVRGLLALLDTTAARGGTFNVGSSDELAILDLAQRAIERTGSGSSVRFVSYDAAYEPGFEDLERRVPDTAALNSLAGWAPELSIDDAIDDVIAFERARALAPGSPAVAG